MNLASLHLSYKQKIRRVLCFPVRTGLLPCSGSRVGCKSKVRAGGTPASTGHLPRCGGFARVREFDYLFSWLISPRN